MLLRAHIIAWYKKFAFSSKYPTSLRGGGTLYTKCCYLKASPEHPLCIQRLFFFYFQYHTQEKPITSEKTLSVSKLVPRSFLGGKLRISLFVSSIPVISGKMPDVIGINLIRCLLFILLLLFHL